MGPEPGPFAGLDAAEDQRPLDFLNRLGDLDAAGTSIGAVEGGATAPHPLFIVQDFEALLEA